MPIKIVRYHYMHPVPPGLITEDNYHEIANDLRGLQVIYTVGYLTQTLQYGGDDDTDYMRSCFDANIRLLHLAYDGSRAELVHFLYGPETLIDPDHRYIPWNETLQDINSAGGLAPQLENYLPKDY